MISYDYYRALRSKNTGITKAEAALLAEFTAKYGEMDITPIFDVSKANTAQAKYCKDTGLPEFYPRDGRCWSCRGQIFEKGGISVQQAATELITGCPICHRSYCD